MRFEFIISFLNCEIWGSIVCLRIELMLSKISKLIHELSSSWSIKLISSSNSCHGGICSNILSQGDIDNILNIEPIISFEINLSCIQILFDELKERIGLQRNSFLRMLLKIPEILIEWSIIVKVLYLTILVIFLLFHHWSI